MEFKKCERCGCFFVSEDCVCVNCLSKDKLEISKLKDYFSKDNYSNSLTGISVDTGISEKNLTRYLESQDFEKIKTITEINNIINDL